MPRCLRPGLQLGSGRFVVWMYPTLDRVSDGHAASFPAVWAIHAVIPVTVWFLPPVVGVFIISVQGLILSHMLSVAVLLLREDASVPYRLA